MNTVSPSATALATTASVPVRRRIRVVPKGEPAAAAAATTTKSVPASPEAKPALLRDDQPSAPSNKGADGSYIVGKGRTPVQTRWKKGQSGNPRGKKKGTPNTDTIIIELMETPITVKTANGERKMSRKAALFQRMWEMAAKGDLKAARFLFDRYGEAQGRRADKDFQEEPLSDTDRDELASFMAALRFGTDEIGSETLS